MTIATRRVLIEREVDTENEFEDLVSSRVTVYAAVPASVVRRVKEQRQIDSDAATQIERAVIRFPNRFVIDPDDIITLDTGEEYRVRSVISTTQVARWFKAVAEREV